tara:strand:+ start:3312 stop:4325 length:1014 start_codon:yes stop_codon:yes gene_type:complete
MIKIAHIYASQAKFNSGDLILGKSTKKYFQEKYLDGVDCEFTDFDCRVTFNETKINSLNKFDYILVGGGGLILPDSAPNNVSGWQWVIPKDMYDKIDKPIYVISIGYNLFYGQDMTMSSRENSIKTESKLPLFKENIKKLINKAEHFSMRHNGDRNSLLGIIGSDFSDKVKFEFCPSIWYVKEFWSSSMDEENKKFITIEIKDDREWRRYGKIGKSKFYSELTKLVKYCITKNIPVAYMSHDGSKNFYNHLRSSNINIPLLDNSSGNETKIKENYSKVKTILCSAGHSQMMSHGLGIKTISLVSHPKLRYFCDDTNNNNFIEINETHNVFDKLMELI